MLQKLTAVKHSTAFKCLYSEVLFNQSRFCWEHALCVVKCQKWSKQGLLLWPDTTLLEKMFVTDPQVMRWCLRCTVEIKKNRLKCLSKCRRECFLRQDVAPCLSWLNWSHSRQKAKISLRTVRLFSCFLLCLYGSMLEVREALATQSFVKLWGFAVTNSLTKSGSAKCWKMSSLNGHYEGQRCH